MSGPLNKGIGAIDGITEMMHHIPLTAYWGQSEKNRLLESLDTIIFLNPVYMNLFGEKWDMYLHIASFFQTVEMKPIVINP